MPCITIIRVHWRKYEYYTYTKRFILSYIRADLQKITETNVKLVERKKEFVSELEKQGVNADSFAGNVAKNLLSFSEELTNTTDKIEKDLVRCVELLTVGSEATE